MPEHPPSIRGSNSTLIFRARCLAVGILSGTLSSLGVHAQDYSDFFSYNGSFEFSSADPPITFTVNTYHPEVDPSPDLITGWWMKNFGSPPAWLEGASAQDGNRYIKIGSQGGSRTTFGGVEIDGATINHTPFTVGEIYELSFWAAGGAASNNMVAVSLSMPGQNEGWSFPLPTYSQSESDALPGLAWQQFTLSFVATGSTLKLSVISPVPTSLGYQSIVYLDNFTLTQVPEPGSAVLACAGGVVMLVTRRRKNGARYQV